MSNNVNHGFPEVFGIVKTVVNESVTVETEAGRKLVISLKGIKDSASLKKTGWGQKRFYYPQMLRSITIYETEKAYKAGLKARKSGAIA